MRTMNTYKAYNFRRKDPVIDELRTIFNDHLGGVKNKALAEVCNEGGPATTTMHNWFHGKTMRPTSAAIEAAGRAIGHKRVWVKMNGSGNGHRK